MTAPSIDMELYIGGAWENVTPWVKLPAGITVTRGRNNEASDPDPGTLVFTVDNSDGRFTIGNTSGAYGANFKKWVPVRYNVNGVRRFTGYVRKAPTKWSKGSRKVADNTITCVDVIGLMAMSPVLTSWAGQLIGALNPTHWWPLSDASLSTTAVDAAGSAPLAAQALSGSGGLTTIDQVVQFGQEGPPTMESDTQCRFAITDDGGGGRLNSSALGTVAAPFTVLMLMSADTPWSSQNPLAAFSITNGTQTLALYTRTPTGDWTIAEAAVTATLPNYAAAGATRLIAVTVTSTTVSVLGTGVSITRAGNYSYTGGTFIIGSSPELYSNAAIIPGAMSAATFSDLNSKLLGSRSDLGVVLDWINRASSEAGYATSATATLNRTMQRPDLKGSNPVDVGNQLATAADAVFVASRLGVPGWLDLTYCPARVDLDSADFLTDLLWDDDEGLSYSEVWVDGVKVATANVDQFPRKEKPITGLLPDADLAHLVNWFANTGDIWAGGRISGIAVNLWPMDSTKTGVYLGLDLRSRIYPTGTPAQIPTPMVQTVEGYTDTVTDKDWTLAFSTAPDPRFVLGDTVAGVLGSGYRLTPLLP